jgi:hypothetical protein
MFGEQRRTAAYWSGVFDATRRKQVDTWDYQFQFASWSQSGLHITPKFNLVSNVGFGEGATHTTATTELANLPAQTMPFPLVHPQFVMRNVKADLKASHAGGAWRLFKEVLSKTKRYVTQNF